MVRTDEVKNGVHVCFTESNHTDDVEMVRCKASNFIRDGFRFEANAKVTLRGCEAFGGVLSGSDFATTGGVQYAHGVMLGKSSDTTRGVVETYIDGFNGGGLGPPSSDYTKFNKDGICVEKGCKDVYVKNLNWDGASDGVFDFKGDRLFIGDSKLLNGQRLLRVWFGTCYIARADLVGPCHIWLGSPSAKVIYQKNTVKFNGGATPVVQVGNGAAATQVQSVDSDPLTGVSFFTQEDYKKMYEEALKNIDALKLALESLNTENLSLKTANTNLANENTSLKQDKTALQAEVDPLKAQNVVLQSKVDQIKAIVN